MIDNATGRFCIVCSYSLHDHWQNDARAIQGLPHLCDIDGRPITDQLCRWHLAHFLKPIGVGQIELVSEFVRILSLSVRLFGNLFAGEVLVTVMTNLIPVVVPAVFLLLETLFGFIQATVFTVLCLAYFTLNTTSHHADHEDEAHNPVHATPA